MNIYSVSLTKHAKRNLLHLPAYIVRKFQAWVNCVETYGLVKARKIRGYNDELLKGRRVGQRSIRLSKAYRAIYKIDCDNKIKVILVLEVNKHEY